MIAKIHTGVILGVEAVPVRVEVEVGVGMPHFRVVGMGDRAVAESRHRVRAAITSAGFPFPARRLTVNLAPANLRKDGSSFDLPIALGLLVADGLVRPERLSDYLVAGELALDGSVRSVPGGLVLAARARELGLAGVILPRESAREAAVVSGIEVLGCRNLAEVVDHLKGERPLDCVQPPAEELRSPRELDLTDVRGQEAARFALEVAAAGGHNLFMVWREAPISQTAENSGLSGRMTG